MDTLDPHGYHWLAFRYLAGELSDGECEEFERTLATDQEAREALASGVEMTTAIRCACEKAGLEPFAGSSPVPSRQVSRWRKPAAWLAIVGTLSASLLIAAIGPGIWSSSDSGTDPVAGTGRGAASLQLANLWIEARNDLADQSLISGESRETNWFAESDSDSLASGWWNSSEPSDVDTPSWMLAAVRAGRADEELDDADRDSHSQDDEAGI